MMFNAHVRTHVTEIHAQDDANRPFTICHLVRNLRASRESDINSVNVIPNSQRRRRESAPQTAGAAKDLFNKI